MTRRARPAAAPARERAHDPERDPVRARGRDPERGSITLLTIGVLVVALALVLTLAAATAVHLDRKRLYDAADELAAAAADQLDDDEYYRRAELGLPAEVVLDDASVADAVRTHLREHPEALRGLRGVQVTSADAPDGRTAEVVLRVRVRPGPLTWVTAGFSDGVTITARARARAE